MPDAPRAPCRGRWAAAIVHKGRIAGPEDESCHPFQMPDVHSVRSSSITAGLVTFASCSRSSASVLLCLVRRSDSSNSADSSWRAMLHAALVKWNKLKVRERPFRPYLNAVRVRLLMHELHVLVKRQLTKQANLTRLQRTPQPRQARFILEKNHSGTAKWKDKRTNLLELRRESINAQAH